MSTLVYAAMASLLLAVAGLFITALFVIFYDDL